MAERGRYLVGQKLSDYQIEKIIRSYAEGISATKAATELGSSLTSRSPNTVGRVYELIRNRLLEIGFFPHPGNFAEALTDPEYARTFPWSATARNLEAMSHRMQGVTERNVLPHFGELLFRAQNPDLTPEAFFRDIKLAIKHSGPLNRPPRNPDVWLELNYIMTLQRQSDKMRLLKTSHPEGHGALIRGLQKLIEAASKRMAAAKRKAARRNLSLSAKTDQGSRRTSDKE